MTVLITILVTVFVVAALLITFSLGMVTAIRMMENMEKKYEKKSNSDTHRYNSK